MKKKVKIEEKKEPKFKTVKYYKFEYNIALKDGSSNNYFIDEIKNKVSLFNFRCFRKLWVWFYLRENSQFYTLSSKYKDGNSIETFKREDIKRISARIYSYEKEEEIKEEEIKEDEIQQTEKET